jgi:hypothetical protein
MTKVWILADHAQVQEPMRANRVAIVIQPDRFVSAAKRIRRDEAVRQALHYADAITRRAAGLGFRKGARSS